jgi:hypothetical protein
MWICKHHSEPVPTASVLQIPDWMCANFLRDSDRLGFWNASWSVIDNQKVRASSSSFSNVPQGGDEQVTIIGIPHSEVIM